MDLIILVLVLLGYVAGVNLPWIIQLLIIYCMLSIFVHKYNQSNEMEAMLEMIPHALFVGGMLGADLSTLIMYPELRPNLSWILEYFNPPELRK
ncbi:hypothetical protein KBC70_02890 [Candidatus Woesebacteria bacterium]|nr:hypothetical protein [Candidatus Woesebacteria bacterium]